MVGYEWTCNACSATNPADINVCNKCGCSATASSDEIDKHLDPDGYNRQQAKEKFSKKLTGLLFFPFFLLVFAISGRAELLLLCLFSLGINVKTNHMLLKAIWNDLWFRNALIVSSLFLVTVILSRSFLTINNSNFGWYMLAWVVVLIVIYYVLFKSRPAKKFFERYYQENGN